MQHGSCGSFESGMVDNWYGRIIREGEIFVVVVSRSMLVLLKIRSICRVTARNQANPVLSHEDWACTSHVQVAIHPDLRIFDSLADLAGRDPQGCESVPLFRSFLTTGPCPASVSDARVRLLYNPWKGIGPPSLARILHSTYPIQPM